MNCNSLKNSEKKVFIIILHCLVLPCLGLSWLGLVCLALSYLIPYLILSYLSLPNLIFPYLILHYPSIRFLVINADPTATLPAKPAPLPDTPKETKSKDKLIVRRLNEVTDMDLRKRKCRVIVRNLSFLGEL